MIEKKVTDFSSPVYDRVRSQIEDWRANSVPWDRIYTANLSSDEKLQQYLDMKYDTEFWPAMSVDMWKEFVTRKKETDDISQDFFSPTTGNIIGDDVLNTAVVGQGEGTAWQCYKKTLISADFNQASIRSIEKSCSQILQRLSFDKSVNGIRKGLVIGNVQSGKTANMTGLMAMAADNGFNIFIILSGTIENLREQTEERMLRDLGAFRGNYDWERLRDTRKNAKRGDRLQDLRLQDYHRYFTVCLKNSRRLENLLKWLHEGRSKERQMKILIIDDEADQAGINTKSILNNQQTKINGFIQNLSNGLSCDGSREGNFGALNYVAYTATPYANILNDARPESIYPRDFILTLDISNEYFGPQQIFGVEGDVSEENQKQDGLNIVREIPGDDVKMVGNIHVSVGTELPESLKDSISWFLCCAAAFRYMNIRKPVSMLLHTSQRVIHHERLDQAVESWIDQTEEADLLTRCREIWERETQSFTLNDFWAQYPTYGLKEVKDYPEFEELVPELKNLISAGTEHILLNEDKELTYSDGIHVCVDNGLNNNARENNEFLRIVYPDEDNMPEKAPAFLVIGGATLSRGLTIVGLVTTYFLRSVRQADTLMQMGRWFGYRRGYEMLQRIWLTERTRKQFLFLSSLDQELRDDIKDMEFRKVKPMTYGPHVKNTPGVSFIRITSENKKQSASGVGVEYSGFSHQTHMFENDLDILEGNLKATENFINSLGTPDSYGYENTADDGRVAVWRAVDFDKIEEYLSRYSFQKNQDVFSDIDGMLSWMHSEKYEDVYKNWNVILAGTEKGKRFSFDHVIVNKVQRSRKTDSKDDNIINIGSVLNPKDSLMDIDFKAHSELIDEVRSYENTRAGLNGYRERGEVDGIPVMILYIIDKDSKPVRSRNGGNNNRTDLNAKADIVALALRLPGQKSGSKYTSQIAISENVLAALYPDLSNTDEE